jgi:flagellar motor component MotA
MTRYSISLIVLFTGLGLAVFVTGGAPLWYLDIPSLLIVGVFPFLFVSVLFGFKEMVSAFSAALEKGAGKEKLIRALNFFKIYGKTTWIAGFIAVIIGLVAILANLDDKTALGPNLALVLISMMYGGIINIAIVMPFTLFIKKQMKE